MKEPSTIHYLDGAALSAVLIEWKSQYDDAKSKGLETPRVPEEVGLATLQITSNLAKSANFRNYTYLDDMIGDAIENVMRYIHNFDASAETRSGNVNAFGYISRICFQSFVNRLEFEERQQYYKMKSVELAGITNEYLDSDNTFERSSGEGNIIAEDYRLKVHEYEEKMRRRVEVNKERKRIRDGVKAGPLADLFED